MGYLFFYIDSELCVYLILTIFDCPGPLGLYKWGVAVPKPEDYHPNKLHTFKPLNAEERIVMLY